MKKKTKDKIESFCRKIIFFLIIISIYLSFIGLHNVDNCHNLNVFNKFLLSINSSAEFVEVSSSNEEYDGDSCHMLSMKQLSYGIFLMSYLLIIFVIRNEY